jgi:DHA3 family macrolide efflux protein-like MFS transporter
MTQETGSATVLALGTLMTILPGVLIGPFAGALVDRWDRRKIMIVADSIAALAALTLAMLFWSETIQIWQIYTIMFIRSLAGAFHFPAMQASMPLLVPENQLTRIAGMNQALQGASGIIAPPLGALLITVLPLPSMMLIDVATALIAISCMAIVHIPRPERTAAPASVLSDVRAGLAYIWNWTGLRMVLIVATLLNLLLTPAFSLLPILVTRHFNGDALEFASMEAAGGIGTVIGGVILGIWGGFQRKIATSALGLCGLGIGAMLIGIAPANLFLIGLVGMLITGIMAPITNGPFFAIVQSAVPPEMQGRVFTVMGSLTAGMAPLGLIVAGPVADRVGVQAWYLLGGLACLFLMVFCLVTPAIMNLERHHEQQLGSAVPAAE